MSSKVSSEPTARSHSLALRAEQPLLRSVIPARASDPDEARGSTMARTAS